MDDARLRKIEERIHDYRYSTPVAAQDGLDLIAACRALKAELRAVAGMLARALDTPDRAGRQKLLEMAAARAGDAGEGSGGPSDA